MSIDATVGGLSSNSYVTVAETDTYFSDRGNPAWAALADAAKQAALLLASDYIEAGYETQWQGVRANYTQALSWPRSNVYIDWLYIPITTIPTRLKKAQMELALKASAAVLLADETQKVQREKVDVIEVVYTTGSNQTIIYAFVYRLLGPLLIGGATTGSFSQVALRRA